MKKLFSVAKRGVWLSLMGALSIEATVLMALDLDSLTQKADMVMRAQVLSSQARSGGSQGHILTDVEFELIECWKGVCPRVVTALVLGGKEGVVEQRVSGSAQFVPGEECVVFLKAHGENRFRILGMAQGKYRLEWKPESSEPMAVPEEVRDAELIYTDLQRMAMPLRREMPLSLLRQRVHSKLQMEERP